MCNRSIPLIVGMSACLENIIKADKVRLYIRIGVCYRIAHACLCSEVHHHLGSILCKDGIYLLLVGKIAFDKDEILELFKLLESRLFEPRVIIIVHIIKSDDLHARHIGQKSL